MDSKRTEGPWKRSEENAYSILTPQGGLIAKTSYHWVDPVSARLNAAFIVKACNEYEELIHELRMADGLLRDLLNFKWADDDDAHLRECVNERLVAIEPLISG